MRQDTPAQIYDDSRDTVIQFRATDFLAFCQNGTDDAGKPLYHSDRLTAWGLYMLMLLENKDQGGVITYNNNYFEDIAAHSADMMSDLELPHVLMYFCNLIDGGLLRMEPGRVVLTLAPSIFPEYADQAPSYQQPPSEPALNRNAGRRRQSSSNLTTSEISQGGDDYDDTPLDIPDAE